LQPFFLEGSAGRLFAIYRPPADGRAQRGDVLYVPPFAEEMNRSRRMASVLAERLAAAGWGSLVVDLFGTGDSDGEFSAARLAVWRDDLTRPMSWLRARGAPARALVGLRSGAMLALELAAAEAARGALLARVVLWQPVANGEQMLTQFLRIRLAASITGAAAGETTASLRARLAQGETLEIAGYDVTPGLAADIDALRLEPLGTACGAKVTWLEVVAAEDRPIPPGGARLIESWRANGVALDARPVAGDPFWTLLETTLAPRVIDATVAIIAEADA